MTRYRWLISPLIIFIITRGALYVSAYIARVAFMDQIGDGPWHAAPNNLFLDIWDRWDSAYYRGIAREGYVFASDNPGNVAFFPVYPLLMALASLLVGNLTLAGVLVSHIAFYGALVFLYRLTTLEFGDEATAQRTIFYISLFPTSFFMSAVYPESTFLLFSVATVYFARQRSWFWAGLAGALATGTRFIGILLYGVVLLEWLRSASGFGIARQTIFQWPSWKKRLAGFGRGQLAALWIHLVPLGLVGYMLFLNLRFDDPIAFFTAQAAWGKHELVNPLATIVRDFSAIFSHNFLTGRGAMWRVFMDALSAVMVMSASFLVWRRLGASYTFYTLGSVLVPAATNSTQSMMRYVAVIFPAFMVLALLGRNPTFEKAITIIFATLLAVLSAVFVNWGFVA